MTVASFKILALSFPDTIENPHFDRTVFKIKNKKIFASLHVESKTVNFKFSPVDQSVFCDFNKDAVYAVPNKWGKQGWTTFELKKLPKAFIVDALQTAYKEALKSKTSK